MKNLITSLVSILFLLSVFSTAYSQSQIKKLDVHFDNGAYQLTSVADSQLSDLFNSLSNYTIKKISIAGHTDNQGDKNYNQLLSENRSNRVRQFFLDKGIEFSKIETSSFGLDMPISNNKSEIDKLKNRRVEISIYLEDKIISTPIEKPSKIISVEPAKVSETYSSLNQLMAKLQKPPRCFTINNNRDTTLVGNNGSVLYIKANSFNKKLGVVNIYLKESIELSDMLLDGLTTTSDNKILESGGMIKTSAKDINGNDLELEKNKSIVVLIPSENPNAAMQLFDGDSVKGKLNWKLNAGKLDNTRDYNYPKKELLYNSKSCSNDEVKEINKLMNNAISKDTIGTKVKTVANLFRISDILQDSREVAFNCESLKKYYKKYKVTNPKDLYNEIKKEQTLLLYKEYGVNNEEQLYIKMKEVNAIYEQTKKQQETFNYIFEQKKLGLANCDLFWNYNGKKINLKTEIPFTINEKVVLVFTERKSIIGATISGLKNNQFLQIPENFKFTLVGIKIMDGKAMLGMKKIISSKQIESLDYTETTIDAMRKALEEIK
jgi:hypothetical protein